MLTVPTLKDNTTSSLDQFRKTTYTETLGSSVTLFDLFDTISSTSQACKCPAHCSLETVAGHAAIYRALREQTIAPGRLIRVVTDVADAANLPRSYAIDTTVIPRPHARTSPDRQLLHGHGHSRFSHQTFAGWKYQVVTRLTGTHDSWSLPVVVDRVCSDDDLVARTIDHIVQVCGASGARAWARDLFLVDAGYPSARLTYELRCRCLPAEVLARVSSNQVFYRQPDDRPYPLGGRPRKHGFALSVKQPQLEPDAVSSGPIDQFGQVTVSAWFGVHQKLSHGTRGFAEIEEIPVVAGTVIIVEVEHLRPSRRRGRLVLFYSGQANDLFGLVFAYLRRFDIEHLFRYWKTTARIGDYRAHQPGAEDTWLRLHALAVCQLYLARGLITHRRLPWERPRPRPPTPGAVRRQVSSLLANAWSPTVWTKPGHAGPGSTKESHRKKRKRFPLVRKPAR